VASLSNEEYQIEAIEFVHNIRVLLGVATQARISQGSVATEDLSSTNVPSTSLEDVVIMDYGCGSGRFLIGLLSAKICFKGYIGVDVNSQELQWLRQAYKQSTETNITSFFSTSAYRRKKLQNSAAERLRFVRVDIQNERYNKKGRPLDTDSDDMEKTMIFPSQLNEELVGSVDIMILRSVFSQMLAADMYHHLLALHPILKAKSGVMIVSLFLNSIPSSPVETVVSPEEGKRGKVLVSKEVFEKILYETGYRIRLYLAQWNSGEDVYVLSTDGIDPKESSLIRHDE
jgi:SAM-dependent methyltransferase